MLLPSQTTYPQSASAQIGDISTIDTDAAWCPDGTQIAFVSGRSGNLDIWSIEPGGSNLTNLTHNRASDGDFAWSPDGKAIAFTSDRSGSYDIWVMNADGSNPTRLLSNTDSFEGYPRWSPDGRKIAFVRRSRANYEVWGAEADGSNSKRLSPLDGRSYLAPSWLSNDQVVFLDREHIADQVWIVTLDNPHAIQLTPSSPSFNALNLEASPTAHAVAFLNRNDGNIWIIEADGTGRSLRNGSVPVWSADGKFLAFHSMEDGTIDIWTMKSDGTDPTNVTRGEGGSFPTWSPDNTRLAFTSDRSGDLDVWVINADGSNPRNLTGEDHSQTEQSPA
jgi:Tol biopolymer transport system component